MYFVYILRCADDTLYTGITNDLEKRIAAHNGKRAAKYTRSRAPITLVYAERCRNRASALKKELRIKSFSRKEKLALIDTYEV